MRLTARSFLHNQVRIIAGSLIKVGSNIWDPKKIKEVLISKNRNLSGETAPPHGLYLEKIKYLKKDLNPNWPLYKLD